MGEPSHLRHCRRQLQTVLESLFVALSAWRGMANHLASMPPIAKMSWCRPCCPRLRRWLDRGWCSDPQAIREACSEGGTFPRTEPNTGYLLPCSELRTGADSLCVSNRGERIAGSEHAALQWRVRGRLRVSVPDPLPGMLDALRIVIALAAVELFWIGTGWPQGPTMLVFTAIGVMLFARQADAAYSSALEFALGCGLAATLAAILLLAVLPSIHGGFLALSMALALFLLPLGALSAGSWHRTLFVAAVTNLIPVLAIENETDYGAADLFNTAVVVVAGTAVPVIFFRLLPPLSPQRRTQRLLMLTLRDLRRLLCGRCRFSQGAWLGLTSRRLAAMPEQATLEEEAELLAALSVGEAASACLARPPRRRANA